MIIGIDASRANHKEKTGVEWYAYHVIQNLKKNLPDNVRVVLYSDVPLEGDLALLPDNWTSKVLNWPIRRLWTQGRMSLEMLFSRPDVLFVPAHVVPLIHPKKTIMTVHDVAAVKFKQSYNWFEKWYSVWSAKMAVKKMWKIIVPSEFTKKELLSLFKKTKEDKKEKKIFVVSHGYDRNYKIIQDLEKIKSTLNQYNIKQPFLMSIGRLEEKKNTWRIIKAFDKLKSQFKHDNLQLVLIGKPGYGYEKIKTALDESEYKKDIILPGWVDQEQVPHLMNSAEVFVFPSLYEGFGLPILEAMACGTPIVASKNNSLEEVGGDVCLYTDSSIEQITKVIHRFLDNSELTKQKIKLGLERVKDYSWEKCAKQTADLIIG